ncbi:MAG TPA: glycosyltransferase family 39 protein [Phycisphaerae bacterium]|nr:glycosyltransferase family 39 protein [Phycisphaerae bacterium]HON68567.1 glycosyltransferase family 39 protein [Phycisphaerae bacterium]HPP28948.1 glycosyltransferase family 39 protein [Phycisphaerae bacterium]HPU28379.1 glycosyltransferase family 39 protein [Phycisphaerae bacterium]HQE28950.1 glycosyltransferase family 39 protein [Phycisphaerae bacterium]
MSTCDHSCINASDGEKRAAAVSERRYSLALTFAVFLLIRAVVLVAAYTAPLDRTRPNLWWVDMPLSRWDYGHYAVIMERGYPPGDPRCEQIAFFPGYPLAGRLLRPWLPPDLALPVVSHIAAAVAVCFLYLWARRLFDPKVAFWGATLLSACPPAMFLSAGYADALLLACVAVALWLLQKGWIYSAALASGYATLTRPTGLALAAVIVLWAWFDGARLNWTRRGLRVIAIGTIAVSGFIVFQAYLWHHYGRPDAFVQTQSNWGMDKPVPNPVERIVTLKPLVQPALKPLKYLARGQFDKFGEPLETWSPMFSLLVLVVAVLGLCGRSPIPRVLFLVPIFVFLMAYLPDPYRGARMVGIARYQLMSLPCFVLVGSWMARRWHGLVRYALIVGMVAVQCMYARLFADWRYIG